MVKLSGDMYSFSFEEVDGWKHTTVSTNTGKEKKFSQKYGSIGGLKNHFNSLTDGQLKDLMK